MKQAPMLSPALNFPIEGVPLGFFQGLLNLKVLRFLKCFAWNTLMVLPDGQPKKSSCAADLDAPSCTNVNDTSPQSVRGTICRLR